MSSVPLFTIAIVIFSCWYLPLAHAPQVIVFMVGGVTYEEACKVAELNASLPSGNVVLGGSFVHNSTSFLEELNLSFGPANQERGIGAFR